MMVLLIVTISILIANNLVLRLRKNPKLDVNKDGIVDIVDLLIVTDHYGESTIQAHQCSRPFCQNTLLW